MISNKELIKQFDKHRTESIRSLREQRTDIRDAQATWAGAERTYRKGATEAPQIMVGINIVKPFIDSVSGFAIQNRRRPVYHAVIMDNQEQRARSEYLNKFSNYIRENTNADQIESRQDLDMFIGGIGIIDSNLTYDNYASTSDPNGEIIKEHVPLEEAWWDSAARGTNLLDATFVGRDKKYHIKDAMDLFEQDRDAFIPAMRQLESGKFWDESLGVEISLDLDEIRRDMVNVSYYQWYEINKFFRAKNPLRELLQQNPDAALFILSELEGLKEEKINTSDNRREEQEDVFDFKPDSEILVVPVGLKSAVTEIFTQVGFDIEFTVGKKKEYFTSIMSGEKIFTKYKNIDQTGFSIKFKTGNYDPVENRWFGIVKSLQEPAELLNKVLTEMIDIMAATPKPGLLVERSAIDDETQVLEQYNTNAAIVYVEDGALSGGKIQPKQIGGNLTGYSEILALALQFPHTVTGIQPEFFGVNGSAAETGVLQRQKIKRVISLLAGYFDSITLYQKEDAKSMIPLMRALAEESQGRLFSIVGENGVRTFQELGLDEFADKYEVSIGEAPDTDTAKQDAVDALTGLIDRLLTTAPDKGLNVAKVLVDILPSIPNDIKIKMDEALSDPEPTPEQQQQQQEQQALQQQAVELELQKQQAEIQQTVAKTAESEAKVRETDSKVVKNIADSRETEANADILEKNVNDEVETQIIV